MRSGELDKYDTEVGIRIRSGFPIGSLIVIESFPR